MAPYKMAVSVEEVMQLLSVGRNTAIKIGKESGAFFKIGSRTLYNLSKLQRYIDGLSEEYVRNGKA